MLCFLEDQADDDDNADEFDRFSSAVKPFLVR